MATVRRGCFLMSLAAGGVFLMKSMADVAEASKVVLDCNKPRDEHRPVKVSEIG